MEPRTKIKPPRRHRSVATGNPKLTGAPLAGAATWLDAPGDPASLGRPMDHSLVALLAATVIGFAASLAGAIRSTILTPLMSL